MKENILLITAIVCMVSFLGYTAFMIAVYVRFILRKQMDFAYNHEPLSIIICARNEADNLRNFLPSILGQDRDLFEVIVVDDASSDDTAKVLYEFCTRYDFLKTIHLEKSQGKKLALKKGIESAQYDLMLFTDADCQPASNQWAAEMASNFTQGVEIVLGYGAYETQKTWLNKIIQYDTAITAARYSGFTIWGKPYMGVGRNLAYRKSLWEKVNGFSAHEDLPYGDDDLFIMMAADAGNTRLCFHPNAVTYSVPKKTFSEWKKQKVRHMHAGKRYSKPMTILLGSEMFFELLFWLSGSLLFAMGAGIWFIFFISFYIIYKIFILNGIYKTLGVKTKWNFAPILSVVHLLALFLFGINAIFAKQVKWKQD